MPKKHADVDSIAAAVAHVKATLPTDLVQTLTEEKQYQQVLVGAMEQKKLCMFTYTGMARKEREVAKMAEVGSEMERERARGRKGVRKRKRKGARFTNS